MQGKPDNVIAVETKKVVENGTERKGSVWDVESFVSIRRRSNVF